MLCITLLLMAPQGPVPVVPEASPEGPFQEPIEILHDLRGRAPGDQYGWVARAVGDVDGDGACDFASTAPFHGARAGYVDVVSGRSGQLLYRVEGEPGDLLGWVVAPAGDVDGDGLADVACGAPGDAPRPGKVVVATGADGARRIELSGAAPGERFGEDVIGVPGSDPPALFVGAPKADGAGVDAGRAVLVDVRSGEARFTLQAERAGDLFGNSVAAADGLLAVTALNGGEGQRGCVSVFDAVSGKARFRVEGSAGSANLGWFLSGFPDVTGDGVPEIYATDWHHAKGAGRALLFSGADGETVRDVVGERPGLGLGIGVAGRDDLDGDGVPDLVIGAWLDPAGGKQAGRVDVVSGADGSLLGRVTGAIAGDVLGFDADTIGDVDGDGVPDLLVTSAYSALGGVKCGRTYVLSGASVVRKKASK